ncbi:MAG: phenylalanine--tRNA ligase subunit beta [Clostridioides sp.]|jgi:phenylalanyl-tRNA synthetase beta chain|nr:phenylalanine--tRNA ligase subunit beta [Clostridioides sp.]
MLVPLKWLRDYVDIDVDVNEFADRMTMTGTKVETIENYGEEIENVVVGKIIEINHHPNADKLVVTKVDVGNKYLQIVTGANNISVNDYVPIALDGSTLPGGKKINTGELRGELSEGMMCSPQELNIDPMYVDEKSRKGIYILNYQDSYELGKDIKNVLALRDSTIEFELTSNRPDCRCIIGIAREAAATLGKKVKYPEITVKESDEKIDFEVEIQNPELCTRYIARVVKDVKIEPSPYWMQRKLMEAGVRPINNIVDITNYVMLEMGQPMHAFDLAQIATNKIVVRNATKDEKFTTLDKNERNLDENMLVITNGVESLGIAGVMGGLKSGINKNTNAIIFESASFNRENIRATSKKLGLRTEASARYEKGVSSEVALDAVNRAVQLVEMLGAGKVCEGYVDNYPNKAKKAEVKANINNINALIGGVNISQQEVIDILKSLEFECEILGEEDILVKVPDYRLDMEQEADVVEEVARIYGFDKIPSLEIEGNPTIGLKTELQNFRDTVKDTLISCGHYEILTYSFVSPSGMTKIKDNEIDEKKKVKIINPLGEETSVMRISLIPNMLDVISTNISHSIEDFSAFEFGSIFVNENGEIKEPERICIAEYGKNIDFFELKGVVEILLKELGIKEYEIVPERENTSYHPGRCANVVLNGKVVGTLGEVNPDVAENYDLGKRVYICELNANLLFENQNQVSLYKPLPKYPSTSRDIALVVNNSVYVKQIDDIIKEKGQGLVESFELFDVYTGNQIQEGYKSVAYNIVYRSSEKTLTDEDVNEVHEEILKELKEKLDANLRAN